MTTEYAPIKWKNDKLYLLDQRRLPQEEIFEEITDLPGTIKAIKDMVVRGAPCIGFTGIYGMALWLKGRQHLSVSLCREACDEMISARPTAVNLAFEVNRCFNIMTQSLSQGHSISEIFKLLVNFGHKQIQESEDKNTRMAMFAFDELSRRIGHRKWRLMTHCNTGFLACGSLGTALGVISYAHRRGNIEYVIADETRPYMQGTRLTAYELAKEGIPYSLAVEGAASFLLSHQKVDAIFVGADRIAANGDTANKVGTSTLAIVAKHYNVPFYVVAPVSSFDTTIPNGSHIEIEMRPQEEITEYRGIRVAPKGAKAINPSFDVTDHRLITGIICENGFINPSNSGELLKVVQS
jgi:methylthioribose-1-phosphate isomerase